MVSYFPQEINPTFNLPNDPYNRRVVQVQYPTADNSYTWYRLYNDGWVEQGGIIPTSGTINQDYQIPLPVEMDSVKYYANRQIERTITGGTGLGWDYVGLGNTTYTNARTKTLLPITHASNSFYLYDIWEVKGFSTQARHVEKNYIKY